MSIEAAYEFLGTQELITLCTASSSGAPHAAPVFFALDGRSVVFTTSEHTHTGKNLLSNPVAGVAAGDAPDPGQTWSDAKGIQIHGSVASLEGDDAAAAAALLRARYSHLDDRIMQSHFFRLHADSVDFIHNAPEGDDEFSLLGVEWTRESF
jgi:uncharacterized protein YhbP (UPF0306 family)